MFRFTNLLPLPLVHAQRVSSRFFYLPLIFLLIIAGDNLNLWLEKINSSPSKWILLSGVIILNLHDLIQHARLWRVDRISDFFTKIPVPLIGDVAKINDPVYITAVIAGFILTIITVTGLVYLSIRNKDFKPDLVERS